MTRNDFIAENADYVDESSLAALETMSDDDFDALVDLCEEAFESDGPGIDCKIIRVANSGVASFDEARQKWNERGFREEYTAIGRACAIYRDAQAAKGQQRRTIAVMPQGEAALVLEY